MDLELSDDQQLFVETTRRFLESESPLTAVRALHDSADGYDRDQWRQGAALGWTALLVPEEQGGGSVGGEGLPGGEPDLAADKMNTGALSSRPPTGGGTPRRSSAAS